MHYTFDFDLFTSLVLEGYAGISVLDRGLIIVVALYSRDLIYLLVFDIYSCVLVLYDSLVRRNIM